MTSDEITQQPAAQPAGGLEAAHSLLTALEAASTVQEVRLIHDRAEALYEAAQRARLADEQLRTLVAVTLRAQRRGGELLKQTPRSKGRPWHGLPTISEVMGLPPNKAKHVAENWLAVAEVPEHLFDEYVTRAGPMPSRAGLLRFRQARPKRPPGRPRADGSPTRLHSVPDPEEAPERLLPPARREPVVDPQLAARAEGWQACVDWLAQRLGPVGIVVDAETANPYANEVERQTGH